VHTIACTKRFVCVVLNEIQYRFVGSAMLVNNLHGLVSNKLIVCGNVLEMRWLLRMRL